MQRKFEISIPSDNDAGRIASIHIAAMESNPLLHAQFPSPDSLRKLRDTLADWTVSQLRNPRSSGVLIARDHDSREIVSFAKWDLPVSAETDETKTDSEEVAWPEGSCIQYLDEYAALAEEAKAEYIGETPCYRLTFVCTDPVWQGLGAGSCLTKRVMELAQSTGLPVYLESTVEAVKMYEGLGFAAVGEFQMIIPRRGSEDATEAYKETCMLWLSS